jgi:hypothetical protein
MLQDKVPTTQSTGKEVILHTLRMAVGLAVLLEVLDRSYVRSGEYMGLASELWYLKGL